MGYELYLRPASPEAPAPEAAALHQALRDAGATGAEGALCLPAGGAMLDAKLAWNDGVLLGVDLDVPFGAPESDFRAAVLTATRLAGQLHLQLLDPQLGGPLLPAGADDALARWRKANTYAVDTLGRVEDLRAVAELAPPPPAVSPRAKVMLLALGALAVLYLVMSFLLNHVLQAPLPPID